MQCPTCGEEAVDVTTLDDQFERYICTGPITHEWNETEVPEDESDEDQADEQLDALAERIAQKILELQSRPKVKPPLLGRIAKSLW